MELSSSLVFLSPKQYLAGGRKPTEGNKDPHKECPSKGNEARGRIEVSWHLQARSTKEDRDRPVGILEMCPTTLKEELKTGDGVTGEN